MTAAEILEKHGIAPCRRCGTKKREPDNARIGSVLREVREATDISQRALAGRMGLSVMYLCDLELGRRNWNLDLIQRYLDACANGKT